MESEESEPKKKTWSFDDLVEVMKPTAEELKYRKQKSKESDFVQKYSKLFKCTKCQSNLKSFILSNESVPTHPCLGVLMCQDCCNYYEDGEFSLDSDGEDKYCRWCGEGGTIFGCSKCICGFCTACIKRHFGLKYFKEVQKDENWLCFFCNQKPLWDQRFICSLAIEVSESVKSGKFPDSKKINGLGSPNGKSDIENEKLKSNIRPTRKKKKIKRSKKKSDQSSGETENSTPNSILKSDLDGSKTLSSNDDSDSEVPIKRRKNSSTSLMERSTILRSDLNKSKALSSNDDSDSEVLIKRRKNSSTSLREGSTSFESQSSEIKTSTSSFVLNLGLKKRKSQRSTSGRKRISSITSQKDKDVSSSFESIKSSTLGELRKILILSKQQMSLGMNWSEKTLEKLKSLDISTPEELQKECQIVKWFLSTLSTYLVEFSNSVERVEKKLPSTNKSKRQQQDSPDKEHCDYTKILQVLGFFSNQIKTFMEKGISLPEVLGADVYNDQEIIGIKKKQKSSNEEISQSSVSSCNLQNNDSDTENNGNDAENNGNDAENNGNNAENNGNNAENNGNDAENSESTIVEEVEVGDSESKYELLDLVIDEPLERNSDFEDMDEKEEDSSSTTVGDKNNSRTVDREDIRQILAVLENA